MAWTTALPELRDLLNDGDTDKLRSRKRLIGIFNGSNVNFKTFEFRRVTNFTTDSTWPLGVFKNNNSTPETVDADDPASGSLKLHTAPVDGDILEASYYVRYFIDSELTIFLTNAMRWLKSTDDFTLLDQGLWPCALKYAAAEAYQKLIQRNMENASATYRTEDAPDDKKGPEVDQFSKLCKQFRDEALKLRDEFYTRQGQSQQPLWSNNYGNVSDVAPQR